MIRLLVLAGLAWVVTRQAGAATHKPATIPGLDLDFPGLLDVNIPFLSGGSMDAPNQFYDKSLPRGIRNNNPGNIRKSKDKWQGLADIQPDTEFFSFVDPVYGIRALAKILRNYRDRYGLNTVQGIINRWAPPVENNTGAYVRMVANKVGVAPTEPLTWDAGQMRRLVSAIIQHENGQQPYNMATIADGISRAGWA
jgi:hypothetical protein